MRCCSAYAFISLFVAVAADSPVNDGKKGKGERLPDVESILTKLSNASSSLASRARVIQEKVNQRKIDHRQVLSMQRTQYEHKLEVLANKTQTLLSTNAQIKKDIADTQARNEDMRSKIVTKQRTNKLLRDALAVLEPKMVLAKDFIHDSLRVTDTGDDEDLKVLEPPVSNQKTTVERFLAEAVGGDANSQSTTKKNAAFLQRTRVMPAEPKTPRTNDLNDENMVELFSSNFQELQDAERQGEAELEMNFNKLHEERIQQVQQLEEEQKSLVANKAALLKTRAELWKANGHVRKTNAELDQRLYGLRVFVRKIDSAINEAVTATAENS